MVMLSVLEVVVDFIYTLNRKYYILFIILFSCFSLFAQDSVLVIRKENIKENNFPKLLVDSVIICEIKSNYKNNDMAMVSVEPFNIMARVESSSRTIASLYPLCLFNRYDNWVRISLNHVVEEDYKVLGDNFVPSLETDGPLKEVSRFVVDMTKIISYSSIDTIVELRDLSTLEKTKCHAKLETYLFSKEYAEFLKSINFSHYVYLCVSGVDYFIVTYRWDYVMPNFKALRNNHTILDGKNQLILMKVYD